MNPIVVLLIIAFYFLMVLGVSWITTRQKSSEQSFYRGDRKSPWWVVAIAMIGTSISGVTYVSVPGMVATSQMSYLQMVLGFVAGYFVVAYVLLPLYYRMNLSSIYTYLEVRYGHSAHVTGAGFFLLSKYLGCAVRMYLTCVVLQLVLLSKIPWPGSETGVPFWITVAVTMLIVWLYSYRGGVKTLVWTDLLQTMCMLAAMVGFVYFVSQQLASSTVLAATASYDMDKMTRIFFWDDANDKRFFLKQFLGGMFTTVAMTGLDQDMMQKNLSCRSLKDAQKNMVSYGFGFLPVNLVFLTLGILLYTYAAQLGCFDLHTGVLTDMNGSPLKADELFPYLATGINPLTGETFLPAIVGVLFVLGLVAAAFSSAGSAVTALTTAVMVDIIGTSRNSGISRHYVHLVNCVMMGVAIYVFHMVATGSVINAVYVVASYTYGPLLGLFFFGLFTKVRPIDKFIPYICVLSPIICFVLDTYSTTLLGGYQMGYELLIINALITSLMLFLTSILGASKS